MCKIWLLQYGTIVLCFKVQAPEEFKILHFLGIFNSQQTLLVGFSANS